MKNNEIIHIFKLFADLLEIKGDNPFKIKSFRKACESIKALNVELYDLYREKGEASLEDIKGVGKGIAAKIIELLEQGKMEEFDEVLQVVPKGLIQVLRIPGLGTKKVKLLYNELGITSLKDLQKCAENNQIASLKGMGIKMEENILKGIADLKEIDKTIPLFIAQSYSKIITNFISEIEGVDEVTVTGSVERWKDEVNNLNFLVSTESRETVIEEIKKYAEINEVLNEKSHLLVFSTQSNINVIINFTDTDNFNFANTFYTSSLDFNEKLMNIAKNKGLYLTHKGLFKGTKKLEIKSDLDLYKALDLSFIEKEMREGVESILFAAEKKLPLLIENKDIKGDLHMHTTASDGRNTIEEMAQSAMALGYEYIAVTDHSKAVGIARGLDEERLLKHIENIDAINKEFESKNIKFRIIKGSEVDILSDGSLDYSDEILKKLDIVVGSIHSGFNMDENTMTKRILKALDSGLVTILGHPTGRLIGSRRPYRFNVREVFNMASDTKTMIELNANPDRLDLNSTHARLAKEMGIKLAINSDAHAREGLFYMEYGVHTARRAWLEKDDVINTFDYKDVMKYAGKNY